MKFPLYADIEYSAIVRPDYGKPLKCGKRFPLHLFVNVNGSRHSISVKMATTRPEWEKMNAKIVKDEIAKLKKQEIASIEKKSLDVIKSLGHNYTWDAFLELAFDRLPKAKSDFYNIAHLIELKIKELDSEQYSTAEIYCNTIKLLNEYYPNSHIKDITVKFLDGFQKWMVEDKNNSLTTVAIHCRNLRHILNRAIDKYKVMNRKDYPFGLASKGKYEIPITKGRKIPLDIEDLVILLSYRPTTLGKLRGHAFWRLSFYCNGMNMVDIYSLRNSNIEGDWLRFHRLKTIRTRKVLEPVEIFLIPEAKEIIE